MNRIKRAVLPLLLAVLTWYAWQNGLIPGVNGNLSGVRGLISQAARTVQGDPYADRNGDGMGDDLGPITCGGGVQGTPVNNCDSWYPGDEPGNGFVVTNQEGHLYSP